MSDYLDEEEQIARMKSWWDENGTSIIVAVGVAVVAIIGWTWYGSHSASQAEDASRLYAQYEAADAVAQPALANQIAEEFPGSAYHIFTLFKSAQAALENNDLAAAEAHLQAVVGESDDRLLADLAKVRLAKIQHALDRSSQALETLGSISEDGYRAWGLETKGDIHVSRGEVELAHAAYQAAVDSLNEGDVRPILDMKLKNVAPFEGEYVEFADTLEAALKDAQDTIDQSDSSQTPDTSEAAGAAEAEAEPVVETEPVEEASQAAEEALND